jgi:hypothetical protein
MGLFMFDNAPLSAHKMPKGPKLWTHHKDGPKMCNGTFIDGSPQHLYYLDDHPTMPGQFKGMEMIIRKPGLWPESGLQAQCTGFKCEAGLTDCCCCWLLFTQPDFTAQKLQLEEYVKFLEGLRTVAFVLMNVLQVVCVDRCTFIVDKKI